LPKFGIAKILVQGPLLLEERNLAFALGNAVIKQFPEGSTSYQEFDHGMMLGPIHIKPDYEENGVVYVLLRDKSVPSYDGTWTPNTVRD